MRLTAREKEIVEILRKEPLISQDELAARLGITRSSAAVHISNLIKKGIILGKGYVLNDRVSFVVLGESQINITVKGYGGKNKIDIELGGFGYLMSRNLARFGLEVKLLSIIGTEAEGERIMKALEKARVDTSFIMRPGSLHSVKQVEVYRSDEDAEFFREDYDFEEYNKLVTTREWLLSNCDWLVAEPALLGMVMERLAGKESHGPGSVCTCLRVEELNSLPQDLSRMHLLVLGCEVDYLASERLWDLGLLERGAGCVITTDGHQSVLVNNRAESFEIPLAPGQGFNMYGNLIEFASGVIYGLSNGHPIRQAIRIGMGTVNRIEGRE